MEIMKIKKVVNVILENAYILKDKDGRDKRRNVNRQKHRLLTE